MNRSMISTEEAPAAIGPYSQAVRYGNLVFLSGQIPLDPRTMDLVTGGFENQVRQVFENLRAVCTAAGGDFDQLVKLTIFLTDMEQFPVVNRIMESYFTAPYPARAAIGVASLPRGAEVEMEAVLGL